VLQRRAPKKDYALFLVRCVRLAEHCHAQLVFTGGESAHGSGSGSGSSSMAGGGGGGLGGPRSCGVLAPHVVALVKKVLQKRRLKATCSESL
jgi:hypothetical protein